MGLYLGGLIIGRIFASEIWRGYFLFIYLFFFFWGGGGDYYRNFTVLLVVGVRNLFNRDLKQPRGKFMFFEKLGVFEKHWS